MSSTASMMAQRLKETAGLSKATVDEDVAACVEKLASLERDVSLLRKVLETSNAALNVQVPRAKAQMVEVLLALSGKLVHGADAEHYQKYRAVHEFMDETQPKALTEKFQKAVVLPLEQWAAAPAEVRAEQSEYEKVRVAFDHYKDKSTALVEAKRQAQLKGKVVDKASEEKLARNLEKLKDAETAFQEARDKFVGRMLGAFDEAHHRMDLVLLRVMQYETEVFTQGEKCVQAFAPNIGVLVGLARDRRQAGSAVDSIAACIARARRAPQRPAARPRRHRAARWR